MINFDNMFNMQGMLFLLMIIGAVLTWKKIITADGQKLLTDLVMDVTLPALSLIHISEPTRRS